MSTRGGYFPFIFGRSAAKTVSLWRVVMMLALLTATNLPSQTCHLYPLVVPASALSNATPGAIVANILQGTEAGQFGWLTWAGSPSEPTLVTSLNPPGNSSTFVNADLSSDQQLSPGDWVMGKPGVSNSRNIRDALDTLLAIDITVPVWDRARGQGARTAYRICAFARIRLLNYQLPQENRITARFLGYTSCAGQNFAPTVNAGPDLNLSLPGTATLDGSVQDDGLPVGGSLTQSWSVVSGPGSVIFANSDAAVTTATFHQPGTYVLRLVANDSEHTTSDEAVILVDRENRPPVAWSQTVTNDEDHPLLLFLQANDVDGDALTYLIDVQPQHGEITLISSNAVRYTPAPDYAGPDFFTFHVRDGALDSGAATITITNLSVNDAPTADAIDMGTLEDTAVGIVLSGADVEGDVLMFSIRTMPTHGSLVQDGSGYRYTPQNNFHGMDQFTYQVSDGLLTSDVATVSITVTSINDRPMVSAGVDQLISQPVNTVLLNGSVNDVEFEDGQLLTTLWSVLSGPGLVAFGDAHSAVTTATFATPGIYALELVAEDGYLSAVDELTVVVNQAPMVHAGLDQTNLFPTLATLTGAASDADGIPSNGLLSVMWSKMSGPGEVTFGDLHATNTTASFSESGLYELQLIASDTAAAATNVVTVLVNKGPVVHAGSDQTNTALHATLVGTVSDDGVPADTIITSQWSKVSGPGEVTFTDSISPQTTVTFEVPGVYILRLTTTDSIASGSDEMAVSIHSAPPPGHQPTAGSGSFWTYEDRGVKLYLEGEDDEGHPLTYRVVTPPEHGKLVGRLDIDPPKVYYFPDRDFFGVDGFTYVANDGQADSDEAVVAIDVYASDDETFLGIRSPQDGSEVIAGQPLPISLEVIDSDGQVDPISLRVDGAELTVFNGPPFTFTWSGASVGTHVLTAVATDRWGLTRQARPVSFAVISPETGPLVNAGPDQLIVLPGTSVIAGTVRIPASQPSGITNAVWSQISGPGVSAFSNSSALETSASFSAPGQYVLELRVTTDAGVLADTLSVEVLAATLPKLTAVRGNRGRDFWLTFLNNLGAARLSLMVSSEQDATGEVEFFDPVFNGRRSVLFNVRSNSTTAVPIRLVGDAQLNLSDSIRSNGIHLTASADVSVYGLNARGGSADGFLALPRGMLGTNYLVLAYPNTRSPNSPNFPSPGTQFAIVATEENTRVRIVPKITTGSRTAGIPYEVVLQKGETYRLINRTTMLGDLTGTEIISDKPVAIFSGHTSAYVPDLILYADHLVEQLPPVNMWGRHFVSIPSAKRLGGDTFRILASENDTRVSLNGVITKVLGRGQVFEKIVEGPLAIATSKPALVAQLANGTTTDGVPSDPFMAIVPATDQWGGSYVLSTPWEFDEWTGQFMNWFVHGSHVNLIVSAGGLSGLMIDGASPSGLSASPIGASGFVGLQLPVTRSTHVFSGQVPFGLLMYGWGIAESYAYVGGIYSDTLEPGTSMVLQQPTSSALVGTEKFIVARAADSRGHPLSDIEISFLVTGANAASGRVRTDPFGAATFAYRGATAGIDVIHATLLERHQSVTNNWVMASANQPPNVDAGGDRFLVFSTNVFLAASATDEGQPTGLLDVSWRTLAGPVRARFAESNFAATMVSFDYPGTYILELAAHDSMFSTRDLVTVTVEPVNLLPSLQVETPYLANRYVGDEVFFRGEASDIDGEIVHVEFFENGVKKAEIRLDDLGDWFLEWPLERSGTVTFYFEAVDDRGGRRRSQTFTTTVHELRVALSQVTSFSPLGSAKAVTAQTADENGTRVPWTTVIFRVTGANPMESYLATDASGSATFVYDGMNIGQDIVAATLFRSPFAARLTNTWVVPTTNLPPIVYANAPSSAVYHRPVLLQATVADDGLPFGQTNVFWRVVSARHPGVHILDSNSLSTTVVFDHADPWQDYELEFVASDLMFASRALVRIRVTDNVPPTISLGINPATNQFTVGQSLTLAATVFDEDDFYVHVDFFEGANLVGQRLRGSSSTQIVTHPFMIQRKGVHTFTARARDNRGVVTTSEPRQVFSGVRPSVQWLHPTNLQSVLGGQTQVLSVQASDPDGSVTTVNYYLQGVGGLVPLGQGSGPQFALSWTPSVTGPATLVARAYDNDGLPSDDAILQLNVATIASIKITAPTTNALLAIDTPVNFSVELEDPAGSVTNIEFRVDDEVVANGPETSVSWIPFEFGVHTLRATAMDLLGRQSHAQPIEVTVETLSPPEIAIHAPTNAAVFPAGSSVAVEVLAEDFDGSIARVDVMVDGVVVAQSTNSTFVPAVTNLSGWHWLTAEALDNQGQRAISEDVRIFVQRSENSTLAPPGNLVAMATSATRIKLSWSSSITPTILERWNPASLSWLEIDQPPATNVTCVDSGLNPETLYRYRVATLDQSGRRSPFSHEAQATTRTIVPNYSVIDLSESIASTLLAQPPVSNPLTNLGFHNFDSRRARTLGGNDTERELGTNATRLKLAVARFKERWPQIQLDYDPALITPASILPRTGYLTGPGGSGVTVSEATSQLFPATDPHRAVKAFLHEHRDLFGHGADVLNSASVERDYIAPGNDARTIVWLQQVAGVPVFNARLIGHLTAAGELASLASHFIPNPDTAADPAQVALVQNGGVIPVQGSSSLVNALADVGEIFAAADVLTATESQGNIRKQTFTGEKGIKGEAYVELTWFPSRRTQLRLCWQVLFTSQWHDEMYLTLVAADSGEVLLRRNLTSTSDEATYRVFTGNSPSPLSPGWSTPSSVQPSLMDRTLVTLSAVSSNASPQGWIPSGLNETRGNNVDAHLDRNDDDAPDSRPVGNPLRVFDFPLDLNGPPQSFGSAATVQLFYWNNWMHDALYGFGFNEAAGNFQADNFGRGGVPGDAVRAQAQDGLDLNDRRHVNNANMSTPPDGYSPRMQMYVFNGAEPDRDGALDAEIVLHEYTHGLSGRLVGGGAGIDALATAGMGEGWSDFYALALLSDPADDVDGVYPMGGYATHHGFGSGFEENYYFGIRRYPYCTDTNKNPLTFRDIDPLLAQPHSGVPLSPLTGPFRAEAASIVHRQGEVWCQMLWEVRANLIRHHGPTQGNSLALQLVTDGLRFSPANPNFVQARDAILLADRIWSGGANAADIWAGFAKRGLGYHAKAPDSRTTIGVRESYDLQPVLATERVEIQGGNGDGIIQSGEENNLLLHVRNQGTGPATQVAGQLSSVTPGVQILGLLSSYPDIPKSESRVNTTLFTLRTTSTFVEGTPIDLNFSISAADGTSSGSLRLFTGVPNPSLPYDGFSALAPPETSRRDLSPLDLSHLEPLWMADSGACLLKAGEGRYVLWRPDAPPIEMSHPGFLAHRLTRDGVVVGQIKKPDTIDDFGHQVSHSRAVKWIPGEASPVELTPVDDAFRFPKHSAVAPFVGSVFNIGDFSPFGHVAEFPTLHAVWDMNRHGLAAGNASVYVRPGDLDGDGTIDRTDVRVGLGNFGLFDALGAMSLGTLAERAFTSGDGAGAVRRVDYNALLTTAALFEPTQWRWLGPLNFVPNHNATAIATLINDAGVVGGYGSVFTGNPELDALNPSHAFRWITARGEFADGLQLLTLDAQPVLQDLGVLGGGLFSQPYAINRHGEMVGYSDFGQVQGGTVNYQDYNFHGVYWSSNSIAPEDLGSFGPVPPALNGYSYAYDINDLSQIVGTSFRPPEDGWTSTAAAVLWQQNRNEGGAPLWEMHDLNHRLLGDDWFVFSAVGINNNGLILASGTRTGNGAAGSSRAGETRAVLLMPVSLAVDVSRNREITLDATDATSLRKVFRFWINDDRDSGDVSQAGENIPGSRQPDYENNRVNGRSDLIDFFPVFLQLHELLRQFPPSDEYEFFLTHADAALNFVYSDLRRTNAFDYLTTPDDLRYGFGFDKAAHLADTIQVTQSGVKLNTDFLTKIQADKEKGVILVEGRAQTTEPLTLEIRYHGRKLPGLPLHLSISGVEAMYRWLNLRQSFSAAIGESVPRVRHPSRPAPPPNFPDAESNGKQFVYLHGFNVSEQNSRAEISEAFRRFWQSGSRAMFTGVSWFGSKRTIPIFGSSLDYYSNVRNAFLTAPHLKMAVAALPGTQKFVAAHSLGNMVVSSAIVDHGMGVEKYFALEAAVPMEAYDGSVEQLNMVNPEVFSTFSGWLQYDRRVWASEWHQLFSPENGFTADGRHQLTWRERFGVIPNMYNFYSEGEEVLKNSDGRLHFPGTAYAWVTQEMLKGKGATDVLALLGLFASHPQAGWAINRDWDLLPQGSPPGGGRFPRTPAQATPSDLSDAALRIKPFFRSFWDSRLADPVSGSDAAREVQVRAEVLATGIPALSYATGANPVDALNPLNSASRNFNLNSSEFQTGWPQIRTEREQLGSRWLHSDLKDVAFQFNNKMHSRIVHLGALHNDN